MIFIAPTPHGAGVSINGDFQDFQELYDALHDVVGGEEEYPAYEPIRLRVLGVCYDLRHALMGDRDITFVENGLDAEKQKRSSILAPAKNVYFFFPVLWPEMIFVAMALNDFLRLYGRKRKYIEWDGMAATVRKLQTAFVACLKQTVSEASFRRMLTIIN